MQEFFVGNYRVDILRNQIVSEGETIALEPKILEVLKVLAESPGEVVSHQVLLDKVWPDMVVAPNALQRCIGQLRKALGDDGKKQEVIVTHPKKGYSLVAEVTLREKVAVADTQPEIRVDKPNYKGGLFAATFTVVSMLIFWWFFFPLLGDREQPSALKLSQFNQLVPLTATDSSEFYSTFSPDGRYVAFSRPEKGGDNLWLKNLQNNQEIQITRTPGRYGQPNWSTDGKQLAFLDLAACGQGCDSKCYRVLSLYVPLSLTEPQEPDELVECETIAVAGLQWISDDEIAYIRWPEQGSEIVSKNVNTGHVQVLYRTDQYRLYNLSYSVKRGQFLVMQENALLQHSAFLFSVVDGRHESVAFTSPSRYSSTLRWYPVWDHSGDNLLFSAETRLYLMDLEGNLQSQVIPTFQDISRPMFHPDGQSIAMTLGKVDRDVAELSFTEIKGDADYQERTFARSILRETDAQYQPHGDVVAFFSQRSGTREIWLDDKGELRQLTHFGSELDPEYFVWSPNGKQLMVMMEKRLYLFDLNGGLQVIDLPFSATKLYQWPEDDLLLMSMTDNSGQKLVSYSLKSASYKVRLTEVVKWAQEYQGMVLFIDHQNKIKTLTDDNTSLFSPLADITTWSRFFVRDDLLYVLSGDDHVWRFDFTSQRLESLFQYPDSTVALTDVAPDHSRVLISKQISAKKEIVLLVP